MVKTKVKINSYLIILLLGLVKIAQPIIPEMYIDHDIITQNSQAKIFYKFYSP